AFLLMGVLGILVGRLNDRFGPRGIVALTALFYGAGYILLSRLDSVGQLYLFYGVVVGIGLSSIDVIPLTTTARWFVRRRGTMTGVVKVGTGAGQMIMPMTAGLLIVHFGWRYACIGVGIIAFVLIVGSGQLLRRDPGQMGLLPDGDRESGKGIVQGSQEGLTLRGALRTGQFWVIFTIYLVAVGCLMTVMVHIVPHSQDSGLDPIKAAGVLSTIGGVSMLGRITTGLAIDRIGNKKSMLICFTLLILCLLWLRVAGEMWMLYLFAAFYGVAHGGLFVLISPTVAWLFGMGSHGVLIGLVAFSGTLGGSLGPVMAGRIFDTVQSYQPVFLILIGMGIVGLILTLFLKPVAVSGLDGSVLSQKYLCKSPVIERPPGGGRSGP
ncbi:MAG: MFS transporter, partial [Deltaproteobacteria bacterium]|nr:MFS transporter [Deltaproteobacteria bacterium]